MDIDKINSLTHQISEIMVSIRELKEMHFNVPDTYFTLSLDGNGIRVPNVEILYQLCNELNDVMKPVLRKWIHELKRETKIKSDELSKEINL